MAASAKTITLDSTNIISDWTVRLENSTFYHVLLDQVQTPHMLEAFFRLSLAILLKRKFSWIGDIELMSKVGDKLQSLHRSSCHTHASEFRSSTHVNSSRHILAVRKFTCEFAMKTVSDDYFGAFHDSSWHFFSLVA
ncbi:hypothetical protein AAG906_019717 [Vitis piasezkii]